MTEVQRLLPDWEWGVEVKGVPDSGLAHVLAQDSRTVLCLLSQFGFDLRTLDGVTIASDYAKAVSETDRGLKCRSAAKPTSQGGVEGVAMALGILREGQQRTRLILNAEIPGLVRSGKDAEKRYAFGVIAHEAAHIHLAAKLEARIPNVYGQSASLGEYPPSFLTAAMRIWDEYAATRMSGFIDPDATRGYKDNIETLIRSSEAFRKEQVTAYDKDGDYKRLFVELNDFVALLLCSFAYLLGHLDSLGQDFDALSMTELLSGVPDGLSKIWMLQAHLRKLWETQDVWTSLKIFSPLCDLIVDLFSSHGIRLKGFGESWTVDVESRFPPGFSLTPVAPTAGYDAGPSLRR